MMMVPIGVSAWTSIYLRGGSYDWNSNSSGSEFKKWDDNNFVKAVTPSTTGNYYFRYYVNNDGGFQCGPDDTTNNWLLTVNGSDLTATKGKASKAFYFAATGGVTYYISVRYVSSTWKVSVSDKPIVRIGGCIGGQNNSWDNDKAAYMAYDSTEDAWYYDVSASDFSSWKRSGEGIIGLDFRFREFNGELNYVFSTGSGNNAHTTLTSTYQELASNTSGAGDRFVGVEEVTNATNYRVWYKNDNGTRKAKVEVTTSDPVPPTTGDNNFYLVGNFMSTDGNNASDINYNNKIFRMKYIGNNQYSFDVPATLTVYSQILSVNGSTTQAYGPSRNQTSGPSNNSTINGTLTSASAKTNNYWLMSARALSSDGMYTVTITVDNNGVPTNWSIKHTQLTRVVYYLPKDGLAQPAYMTRNNSSSAGDNKFFGNVYLREGQECFVLGNIKGKSAWTDSGNPMPTVTKLYKQGNGGGYVVGDGTNPTHPSDYDDWHKVYPALSSGFKVKPAGALTLEYNPSAGQNEKEKYSANNNIGGEVKRAGGDPMDMIESMKVIGPGVGTDWTLSNAREMTYNETLKCWEIKITTTAAESTDNLFRFVANGSWDTNWYENGTADTDKARVPYTDTGDGHAATEADPNVVERTSDAHATPARDIIFNRPAGEWTIRFYTETISSSGGNFFTYNYYYTITGTENTDPDATLSPGTTTWDSYNQGDAKALTVTLTNGATGYKYSYGASSTPYTTGSNTTFGNLSYDGTNVKLGDDVVASNTNTVTIRIQGTNTTSEGAIHDYTYTFNPAVVSNLDFTPKGGFFINKAVITVTNGTAPYTYTIKDASNNVLSTGTSSSATFTISTPGKLTVTDKDGNSATSTSTDDKFDFTYSTSENYANYYNNGTTAQSVAQEGGKDATNIFLKKADYENMRIYAWDYTYDQLIQKYQKGETTDIDSELSALGLKKRTSESNWKDIWENGKFIRSEQGTGDGYTHTYNDTRAGYLERDPLVMLTEPYPGTLMSDSRSITIDGEEYYYLTLPLERLHFKEESKRKVGIIVTRNDDEYTDLGKNADKYKTANYVISSNSSFIYSSVDNGGGNYTNRIFDISELVEPNGNIIFFDNSKVKWSNVYCYAWKKDNDSQRNAVWPGVLMADYDGNGMYIEEVDPTLYDRIQFNNGSSAGQTNDISDFGSGKYVYTTIDGKNVTKTKKIVNQDRYNTYITTPSKYTVEVQNHPNGDDYLRAMPSDKTVLLDPTWGGVITSPLTNLGNEETSVPNWNGVSGQVPGYRKMIPTTLTQTVYGLDNSKTYTVQAIVRVWGELGDKVALKVGDGDAVECETYNSSGISYVNKNGRVDDRYTEGPDPDDTYANLGYGWQKIEASGKPTAAGNLVITLTPTFVGGTKKYDLADVVLLEDANTAGHYWTKLPTDETSVAAIKAGEIELLDRTKYDAFSFFDRNEGNPNAIIKASNRTVIGLRSGIADVQAANGTVTKDAVDHIQSRNTISQNSDGTWSGRYLYLYDESSDWSDCNAYGATVDFKMMGVKYDRQFTANQHSTMFLPYAVTTEQLKTAGFKELQMVNVDKVTSANIPLITWKLTNETLTPYTTTAGQGYIVIAGDNGASLSSFIKPTDGADCINVQAANSASAKKTETTGLVGAYVYGLRYQTEDAGGTTYMNYSYLNDKFRALATVAQGGAEIKPFRATFAVPKAVVGEARMLSTFIIDADEVFTPTGVDKLGVEEQLSGNIYTLDGRLVSNSGKLSELSRGIYVRGGRKIVVK